MLSSVCLTLLVLINASFHLTHAHSYSQSYRGNADQGYPDSSGTHITNFGNGSNKRNFVNIDETPDRTSISGTSFTNDNRGRPSVEKLNVDINNYREEHQGPNVNANPRPIRTQVTNIGNGVGNRNLFVFNDNNPDHPYPRNNQDYNQDYNHDYRGQQNNGYQGRPRVITNIGHGPDNDNQIYVNGKKVFPNADSGVETVAQTYAASVPNTKATERMSSVISDISSYANDFGNGYHNTNRIIINGKEIGNSNAVSSNLNIPNKRQGLKSGRRVYYYRKRNPHFKTILRKNVRDVVKNPLATQYRRRGWRRVLKNMLQRHYY